MIDVPAAIAAIHAAPGEHVTYTKAAMAQLLRELGTGQKARRDLAALRAASNPGASA